MNALVLLLALSVAQHAELDRLMQILRTGDELARSTAADAIARFGEAAEPAVPLIVPLFDAKHGEVQANAMDAVAKIGVAALPHLLRALESDNVNIRNGACGALGQMRSLAKPALPALAKLALGPPDSAADAEIAIRKIVCP
jgi:HEAT repeat protein